MNIAWGVFVLLLCAFLFAIEVPYSLRPDVNKFVGIAIYDVVIEGYALTAWAVIRGALTQALKAICPLIETYTEPTSRLQREWQFSFGVGVPLTLMVVLTNPVVNASLDQPTTWLYILSQLIENSLLGWIVFALLSSANQITHFISRATIINIFDPTPYRPVANWCLTVVVSIMGAITIAILFLGEDMMSSVNLVTYSIAGVLGIVVFFAGMWSTHQHMQKNKERELNRINTELLSLHREIMTKANNCEFESSRLLGSIGGLVTSVFVPFFINFIGKIF